MAKNSLVPVLSNSMNTGKGSSKTAPAAPKAARQTKMPGVTKSASSSGKESLTRKPKGSGGFSSMTK